MSDLKVCRICLNTEVKLHEFNKYKLKECYEQIMSIKLKDNDGLPRYFCYECATLIHKFYKFKKKCEIGQKELKQLIGKGRVTLQKITQIDRTAKHLTTALDIITVTNRVNTYFARHRKILRQKSMSPPPIPIIVPEMIDVDKTEIEPIKIDTDSITEKTENLVHKQESLYINNLDDNMEHLTEDDISLYELKQDKAIDFLKNKRRTKKMNKKQLKSRKKHKYPEIKVERKKRRLNEDNWQLCHMTEEAAMEEFQARANDPKYISAVYKCTSCIKGFSKDDMMKRHNKLRHSESNGPIECHFCRIRFKWKSLLHRHIREHYNKYRCLRCDLTFSRETSAQHHDEFHNGVTRTCEYCNETFKHLSTYYTHLRKHRSKHVCPVCGESFVSPFGLHMHRRVKHIMDTDKQEDTLEETTYCEKCDIKFETTKAYEEHLTHSAMHFASGESAPPMNLKGGSVVRRAPRKQTPCSICNKMFSTLVAYTKHHQASHPETPLPALGAKHCGAGQGQERLVCEICGALLAPNSMYSHLNTHTRKKQYTCTTCGMQFNARGTLQRHYLTHTGEKPVECSLCDKRFTQVASMKLHYRTIHLKQPYPKRNRNKKSDDSDENAVIAEYYQNKETVEDERWRTFRM